MMMRTHVRSAHVASLFLSLRWSTLGLVGALAACGSGEGDVPPTAPPPGLAQTAAPAVATPPPAPPASPVVDIVVGSRHGCVLHEDKRVSCWGSNTRGELGDGTTAARRDMTTARPVAGLTDVEQLAVGDDHTCARRSDGSVWCWGPNNAAELGRGERSASGAPAAVVGVTDAVHLACWRSTCAVARSSGPALAWGQVLSSVAPPSAGDNADALPRTSSLRGTRVAWVLNSLCVSDTSRTRCAGEFRYGSETLPLTLTGVIPDTFSWGLYHGCYLAEGRANCLGPTPRRPDSAILFEFPNRLPERRPFDPVVGPAARDVAAAFEKTFVINEDGSFRAYGFLTFSPVDSTQTRTATVTPSRELRYRHVAVSSAEPYACVVDEASNVHCWGHIVDVPRRETLFDITRAPSLPVTVRFET